jgi:hypothetical protein
MNLKIHALFLLSIVENVSVLHDNLDTTSDPNDPAVIIKIDISNSFNTCPKMGGYYCHLRDPVQCFRVLSLMLDLT